MSNICAGIGRGQMFIVDEHIARRRAIHELYKELLAGVEGVTVMDKPSENYNSNFWLTYVLIDPEASGFTREKLRLKPEAENIESRPLWKPMHLQPVFAHEPFYGDGVAECCFNFGLCLPSGSTLTDDDITRVAETIKALCVVYQVTRC